MRSAIALILTLMMLIAMTAIIGIALTLFQKNFKTYEGSKFRVQSAVLMHDAVQIMQSLVKDVGESEEAFAILVQSGEELPVRIGNIDMVLKLRPKHAKFNINRYQRDKHYEKLYAYFLQYELQRPGYMLDMIEDTLDADIEEKQFGTERVLYDPFFLQGEIKDYRQFLKLIDTYAKEIKDMNIYTIPWNAWVDFSGDFIDEAYMTVEMQRVLEASGGISNELSDFEEVNTNSSELSCEVYLRQESAESIATFDFSFKSKAITNFHAIL